MVTVTVPCAHLHCNVPPENEADPFFTPPSTAGWIAIAMATLRYNWSYWECSDGVYQARRSAGLSMRPHDLLDRGQLRGAQCQLPHGSDILT